MTDVTGRSDLPRVLVVAHNPFSDTQNNGKTLSGFFAGWPQDRLAQVYLTLDEPSFSVCRHFFRLTDLDILKSLARRPPSTAGVVREQSWAGDSEVKASLHGNPLYALVRRIFLARPPSALVLRSAAWRLGLRRFPALEEWIDDFAPDVVFFQSSNATFAFDLVESICAGRGVALVMSTTDDYVTARSRWSPASRVYYRSMQQRYRAAVRRSRTVVAIGQKMADEYTRRFGGHFVVAMNSIPLGSAARSEPKAPGDPMTLHYAGNLGLNRWRVLASVGRALDLLHDTGGPEAVLEVYSVDEPPAAHLASLTASPRVRFCGAVNSDDLHDLRARADVLVHVESFDERNKHVTRLSVSTKIPEYMASQASILAIGPHDVASIEYVADHGTGVVSDGDSPEQIALALRRLVDDPFESEQMRRRAGELARQNHSREATSQLITQLVVDAATAPRRGAR